MCAHPSVSRQHCILQHSETGEVFLYDLGSTHGTFINKQKIPPRTHVALRIGAGVKLGLSSRTLTLMGEVDPARESAAAAAAAARAAQTKEEAAEQRAKARAERIAQQTGRSKVSAEDLHARSDGAGWGFVDDAEVYAEADRGGQDEEGIPQGFEQLVATAKAQGLRLSSKQERLIEQLEKRTAKMLHLKQETERIAAKEVDGLSEGQQRQVERNTQRLTELTEQIDSLKDQISETIREQLSAKEQLGVVKKGAAKGGKGGRGGDDSDDMDDDDDNDDFFDRTERKKQLRGKMVVPALSAAKKPVVGADGGGGGGGKGVAESEESLRAKLADARARRLEVVRAQDALSVERAGIDAQAAAADPLEAYMLQNASEVAASKARQLARDLESAKDEEARLEKLLVFVAPALRPVPAAAPPRPPTAAATNADAASPCSSASSTGTTAAMPAPQPAASAAQNEMVAPPPKRVRLNDDSAAVVPSASVAASAATSAATSAAASPAASAAASAAAPAAASAAASAASADATGDHDAAVARAPVRAGAAKFQAEYAAALAAYTGGGGAAAPASLADFADKPVASSAVAAASKVLEKGGSSQEAATAALNAEREAVEAQAKASRGGLGLGAAKPDAAAIAAAKEAMAAQRVREKQAASMLAKPGLNHSKDAAFAAAASELSPQPDVGASSRASVEGSPMPPLARAAAPSGRPRVEPRVEPGGDMDYGWTAPKGQTGDGKTALNKKFGY